MNAYVDHNFLINCINQGGWRPIAVNACSSGSVKLIVSPWSIYEIGNAAPLHMEELLTIVEELKPLWIFERVDLQLREFVVAWNDFWNGRRSHFDPIGTLAEVHASFFRCRLKLVEKYSLRDYAAIWKRPDASYEADVEFRRQASISVWNRMAYLDGRFTSRAIREIRERYVARQFAISRKVGLPHHQIHQYENLILSEKKLREFISFFVEFGGMDDLLAHRVEEILTFNQWKTGAKLNPHRQLDRFHAVAALPYCDLFVTSDAELIKKSQVVQNELRFEIGSVISGEEFIERLRKLE
jgi:hypothetical protein